MTDKDQGEIELQVVMDTVLDGLLTIDSSGEIHSCNAAAVRIFGYERLEMIGNNVRMLMPPPYHAQHDSYIRNYLETGERKVIGIGREVTARRKDGSTFPMELGINEMKADGRRMFVGTIRDITERKEMDRMKDEFVSTVNHEIRTPLSSIYGSVQLLNETARSRLDPRSVRLMDICLQNCARLSRIVDDILDLEKIMAGKIDYHFEVLEVGPLVQDVVDRHLGMAERFGVSFETELDVGPLFVNVDPSRFNQALVNLLSNAAKYSPVGELIKISAVREDAHVRISVSDKGPGIPVSFREKIFERFARADGSTTRKVGGSGLGLNITKTLIEAFGGRVAFDTVEGEGSTFHFILPIHAEAPHEEASTLRRILYLEDDDSIAELTIMVLQEIAGFEVFHCKSGREALEAVDAFEPQLLLLDVMLPDMDGPQTLAQIRAHVPHRDIPAIFMTARAQVHEQKNYLALGACGVIVKPFDPITLSERVQAMWDAATEMGNPTVSERIRSQPETIRVAN